MIRCTRPQAGGLSGGIMTSMDSVQTAQRVFGEPYATPDGATVIPVARVRGGRWFKVTPVGVFVIRDGRASWVAAVDETRIVLLGEVIGLAAAVIGTLAVLRRPPWPDLSLRLRRTPR
jgi:uncharacterized spore protein YtfJ